jgi:hypothetical protein
MFFSAIALPNEPLDTVPIHCSFEFSLRDTYEQLSGRLLFVQGKIEELQGILFEALSLLEKGLYPMIITQSVCFRKTIHIGDRD